MIEVLAPTLAATSAAIFVALAMRGERKRLELALDIERAYAAKLQNLLMAREAPAEYAAYIEPQSLIEDFPEDAIWDESGLFYVSASEGGS